LGAPQKSCRGCGSENGRVISPSQLERDIESGEILNIDLRSGEDTTAKCGWKRPRERCL
jgi:hypothetical protein